MKVIHIKIKQVPDEHPNNEGEWIRREIIPSFFDKYKMSVLWDQLTKYCDEGHHAVSYERIDE